MQPLSPARLRRLGTLQISEDRSVPERRRRGCEFLAVFRRVSDQSGQGAVGWILGLANLIRDCLCLADNQSKPSYQRSPLLANPAEARLLEVTFPTHLSSQPADRALGVRLDQQTQSGLYGGLFCGGATAPHGLVHQPIINLDIGPQSTFSNV